MADSKTPFASETPLCAALLLLAATLLLLALAPAATGEPSHCHDAGDAADAAGSAADGAGAPATRSPGALSIPDTPVLDQDGNEIRFYSDLVEGRVVAVNFVFTTCTTICPPMGANFGRLQKLMADKAGRDFEMISVSVDPAVDTPQRLKAWAEKFGREPGWTLVTGSKTAIDELLKALRVFTPDKTDHSPILLLGDDARGEWTRAYALAPPAQVAAMIDGLIGDGDSGLTAGGAR